MYGRRNPCKSGSDGVFDHSDKISAQLASSSEFSNASRHPWGRRKSKSGRRASDQSSKLPESRLQSEDDEMIQAYYGKGAGSYSRRGSAGLLPSVFSCLSNKELEAKTHVASASAGAAAPDVTSALVELSRRQQEALEGKQDTIDMLEWQMEQLQVSACREHELETSSRESGSNQSDPSTSASSSPRRSSQVATASMETLFQMGVARTGLAIRYFCKAFMRQMEGSGYSIWRAITEAHPETTFLRKEHTAYALEARINKALFHCFESESFDASGLTKILDPATRALVRMQHFRRMKNVEAGDAVNPAHACFDPDFFRFCENKTREMWALFPWSIAFKSMEERAAFTAAFLDAAKGVWQLHTLAFAMNPVASIIRVGRGMEANHLYVDAVALPDSACKSCHSPSPKVEFMIMPGFRTPGIIKCQVYLHIQCK